MKVATITDEEIKQIVMDAVQEAMRYVSPLKPLYTISEAGDLLDVDERTLRRWSRHKTIEIVSFDGRRYVSGESIARRIYGTQI